MLLALRVVEARGCCGDCSGVAVLDDESKLLQFMPLLIHDSEMFALATETPFPVVVHEDVRRHLELLRYGLGSKCLQTVHTRGSVMQERPGSVKTPEQETCEISDDEGMIDLHSVC